MSVRQPPQGSQDERLIVVGSPDESGEAQPLVEEPGRVMRIAAMTRQLLDEIRRAPLDQESRDELRRIYARSIEQLGDVLAPDLAEELKELSLPLGDGTPTEAELRIAHAQLVGWLEGLFHGIQATLFAQHSRTSKGSQRCDSEHCPAHRLRRPTRVRGPISRAARILGGPPRPARGR